MTRRRLVALVSVAVLFTLGLLVVAAVFFITRTNTGRERLRGALQPWVASKIRGGTIYIGHLGGNFLTYVTVDSLAIRDKRGELFASTGQTTCSVRSARPDRQPRLCSAVLIEHPYVHLIQHANGVWNFKEIFAVREHELRRTPKDPNGSRLGRLHRLRFGDDPERVVLSHPVVASGRFAARRRARQRHSRAPDQSGQGRFPRRSTAMAADTRGRNIHGLV